MADGRTYWYSEDAAYPRRGLVVALGEEFGCCVLAILQVLKGDAKLQNEGGKLMAAVNTISRDGFVNDVQLTRRVVERAAAIGVLHDLEFVDEFRFRCRISGWIAEQERAAAAGRKAKQRANEADVTVGHGESQNVPLQNRTEQDNDSLRSSQISELFAYWQQQCGHPHAKLSPERRRKIAGRLREGYEPQAIQEAIDGAARAAYVDEQGKKHDDIGLICRSAEKLDSFIGRARVSPVRAASASESPSDLLRALDGAA